MYFAATLLKTALGTALVPAVWNLVDRRGGAPRLLNAAPDGGVLPGTADYPVLSGNGQAAAFLYTPSSGGASVRGGQAAATAAGSTTVCSSPPNGLFQTKCQTGTGGAVPNGSAESPSLSADGRYLAFCSSASNLVTGDANGFKDVFVTDQLTAQTRLVSLTASGEQGNGDGQRAERAHRGLSGRGSGVRRARRRPRRSPARARVPPAAPRA